MQKSTASAAQAPGAHDEVPRGYGRHSSLFYVVLAVYAAGVLMSFVSGWTGGQQRLELFAETANKHSEPRNGAPSPDGGAL